MEGCGLLPKTDQHTACFMRQFLFLEIAHSCSYGFSFFQGSPSATLKEATTSRFLTLYHTQAHLQISFTACPQTSPANERAPEKGKAMHETQRLVYVTTYSNKLFSPVNKLTGLHPLPTPSFLLHVLTSTKVPSATSNFSMQEHALRRHLCVKSCLDIIHKCLAMRAVHPDALPKRVLNVNLKKRTQAMLKPFFFFSG